MGGSKNEKRENAQNSSWETRKRIFEYFKKQDAPSMRDEPRREGNGHNYVSIRTCRKFNIAIHLSSDMSRMRKVWTYVFSRDPDGRLDRRIIDNIDKNNPPVGATFVDCSNDPRRGINTRNVCKLERDIDWRQLGDKGIEKLLEDYKWFVRELRRIGVLECEVTK